MNLDSFLAGTTPAVTKVEEAKVKENDWFSSFAGGVGVIVSGSEKEPDVEERKKPEDDWFAILTGGLAKGDEERIPAKTEESINPKQEEKDWLGNIAGSIGLGAKTEYPNSEANAKKQNEEDDWLANFAGGFGFVNKKAEGVDTDNGDRNHDEDKEPDTTDKESATRKEVTDHIGPTVTSPNQDGQPQLKLASDEDKMDDISLSDGSALEQRKADMATPQTSTPRCADDPNESLLAAFKRDKMPKLSENQKLKPHIEQERPDFQPAYSEAQSTTPPHSIKNSQVAPKEETTEMVGCQDSEDTGGDLQKAQTEGETDLGLSTVCNEVTGKIKSDEHTEKNISSDLTSINGNGTNVDEEVKQEMRHQLNIDNRLSISDDGNCDNGECDAKARQSFGKGFTVDEKSEIDESTTDDDEEEVNEMVAKPARPQPSRGLEKGSFTTSIRNLMGFVDEDSSSSSSSTNLGVKDKDFNDDGADVKGVGDEENQAGLMDFFGSFLGKQEDNQAVLLSSGSNEIPKVPKNGTKDATEGSDKDEPESSKRPENQRETEVLEETSESQTHGDDEKLLGNVNKDGSSDGLAQVTAEIQAHVVGATVTVNQWVASVQTFVSDQVSDITDRLLVIPRHPKSHRSKKGKKWWPFQFS